MNNSLAARTNMVLSQLNPNKVTDEAIKQIYIDLPKEAFLPEHLHANAYIDEDLMTDDTHFIMEPMVQARLLQALDISSDDIALDIGCNRGYSSALLSQLCNTVIALGDDQKMIIEAGEILSDLDIATIAPIFTDLTKGYEKEAPYDVIMIEGAVSRIPMEIKNQLKVGGRLACVLRPSLRDIGKAMLLTRHETHFDEKILFDAATPYLRGFEPDRGFEF